MYEDGDDNNDGDNAVTSTCQLSKSEPWTADVNLGDTNLIRPNISDDLLLPLANKKWRNSKYANSTYLDRSYVPLTDAS